MTLSEKLSQRNKARLSPVRAPLYTQADDRRRGRSLGALKVGFDLFRSFHIYTRARDLANESEVNAITNVILDSG
jgi:hypothetical protein